MRLSRFRSSPRGPKKPVSKQKYNKKHPLLLEEQVEESLLRWESR